MDRRISRTHGVIPRGATTQVQDNAIVVAPDDYARSTPFLLLSEDWFGAPGGFQTHPHRGMQTVTFMLDGALEHRDHTGAHSVLRAGDVQWMTAGRGVLHSEMPHGPEPAHTLQLWLNLPARLKRAPARYVDQRLETVPVRRAEGVEARVYAGRSGEVEHPHGSDWPMTLIDIRLEAGRALRQEVRAADRGFVYVLDGRARLGADAAPAPAGTVAWFEPSGAEGFDTLRLAADEAARILLFAGPPIDEPVAFGGPFVMNSAAEIRQAYEDLRSGRFLG